MRHAVPIAKALIECKNEEENNLNLIALAAHLKGSFRGEISALVPKQPQTQKNGWKNRNYGQVPHPQVNPQWLPSMNIVLAVPNAMWNTPVYGQPPQSFHQHPLMQQWPTASNNRLPSNPPMKQNDKTIQRRCNGCGKTCYPRNVCPAYNVQCFNCFNWRHHRPTFSGS